MVNYYRILGVKRSASRAEIRSAYRKLARLRHPDVNAGSPKAAREFALLAKAYHILIDPQERAYYDDRLSAQTNRSHSILDSDNPHARRARNLAVVGAVMLGVVVVVPEAPTEAAGNRVPSPIKT